MITYNIGVCVTTKFSTLSMPVYIAIPLYVPGIYRAIDSPPRRRRRGAAIGARPPPPRRQANALLARRPRTITFVTKFSIMVRTSSTLVVRSSANAVAVSLNITTRPSAIPPAAAAAGRCGAGGRRLPDDDCPARLALHWLLPAASVG